MKWFTDKYGTDKSRIEYPMSFTVSMLIDIAKCEDKDEKLDAIYTLGKRSMILPLDLTLAGSFLTEMLTSGIEDITIKEEVIKALKELSYDGAASIMLKLINDQNESPAFHAYALNAIANMKYIDAIDDVITYMRNHENPYRDSASWSLQKLALEAKKIGLVNKFNEVKACYFECLLCETDDLEGVFSKGNIVYSLSKMEAYEYLPQIKKWLSTQQDAYVIEDALNAIIALGGNDVCSVIEQYRTHPDMVVKQIVQDYIARKGDILNNKSNTQELSRKRRFRIALSFPGDYRNSIVDKIASALKVEFHENEILYDKFHEEELARPNLDIYLQDLYRDESDLIVLFLCEKYQEKPWCGVEGRAIRALMNQIKESDRFMLFRIDKGEVKGFDGNTDGFIDITVDNSDIEKAIKYIIKRYNRLAYHSNS